MGIICPGLFFQGGVKVRISGFEHVCLGVTVKRFPLHLHAFVISVCTQKSSLGLLPVWQKLFMKSPF